MAEKTEKSDFFSRQNAQKSRKNPAKTAQSPGKMTEKRQQNTGGGHPLRYRGAASSARCGAAAGRGLSRQQRRRGIICPVRPVRGDLFSAAGCCRPLLYSYVGRRGHHRRGAGRRHHRRGGGDGIGGIIGPARGGAVLYSYVGRGGGCRGRMAGGAAVWCWYGVRAGCCPLLYSYVGRGGVRSPTGAASSARCGLSGAICSARRGAAALSYIAM